MTSADDDLLVAREVRETVTALARRLRRNRPELGLSLTKLSLLGLLERHGPMPPGALAAAERVQPQSLTRSLNSLARRGLIARRPDPADRRRQLLEITAGGRELLALDRRERDAWLARAMTEELSPLERDLLRLAGRVMDRLAHAIPAAGTPGNDGAP